MAPHPYPPPRTLPAAHRYNVALAPSQQQRTAPTPRGARAPITAVSALHPEPACTSPPSPASYTRSIPADSPEFSFDVLRSDPSCSSLQHIASGLTLHSHVRGAPSSSSPPGYVPAFRVSVMPERPLSFPSPRSGPDNLPPLQPTTTTSVDGRPPTYSTLSFPISGPGFHPSTTTTGLIGPGMDDASLVNTARHGSPASIDDPDNASDGELSSTGKKHICLTCQKRFNRPSSLRIHVNTHTGATPFRCPWPNCGREFNVNSNMRRHYRNHTSPGFSRSQPGSSSSSSSSSGSSGMDHHRRSPRRRRRLPPHGVVFIAGDSSVPAPPPHSTMNPLSPAGPPYPHLRPHPQGPHAVSSVLASSSVSDEDSSVEEASEPIELDNSDSRAGPAIVAMDDNVLEGRFGDPHRDTVPFQRYSQSHLRSAAVGSPPHTTCVPSSNSPGPHRPSSLARKEIYSPSPAYARSALASSRVSTTLRPAFATGGVKDEPRN